MLWVLLAKTVAVLLFWEGILSTPCQCHPTCCNSFFSHQIHNPCLVSWCSSREILYTTIANNHSNEYVPNSEYSYGLAPYTAQRLHIFVWFGTIHSTVIAFVWMGSIHNNREVYQPGTLSVDKSELVFGGGGLQEIAPSMRVCTWHTPRKHAIVSANLIAACRCHTQTDTVWNVTFWVRWYLKKPNTIHRSGVPHGRPTLFSTEFECHHFCTVLFVRLKMLREA